MLIHVASVYFSFNGWMIPVPSFHPQPARTLSPNVTIVLSLYGLDENVGSFFKLLFNAKRAFVTVPFPMPEMSVFPINLFNFASTSLSSFPCRASSTPPSAAVVRLFTTLQNAAVPRSANHFLTFPHNTGTLSPFVTFSRVLASVNTGSSDTFFSSVSICSIISGFLATTSSAASRPSSTVPSARVVFHSGIAPSPFLAHTMNLTCPLYATTSGPISHENVI